MKQETVYVKNNEVRCSGGSADEGHPEIYLNIISEQKQITCPYCSKVFVLKQANDH